MARSRFQNSSVAVLLAILFVGMVSLANAAPAINAVSGTAVRGGTVSLTGSGFGTKSIAAPQKWDSVDNQPAYSGLSNGATIPTGASYPWDTVDGRAYAVYCSTSTEQRGQSTAAYKINGQPKFGLGNKTFTTGNGFYLAFWWKTTHGTSWSANGISANKLFRINVNNDHYEELALVLDHAYVYNGYTSSAPSFWVNAYSYLTANSWHFIEVVIDNTNKRFQIFVDSSQVIPTSGTWQSYSGSSLGNFNSIGVLGYDSAGWDNITAWMDDIYVDNTQARVVLGNASTLSASTHREIQIPSAWSSSSINVTFNQGSFQSGQTAYLFVVDSSGNASAGFPITIGSSGGGAPPPATDSAPTIGITSPTSQSTYNTTQNSLSLSGTAGDDKGIANVTWRNSLGGNGSATNSSGSWSTWSISNIPLQPGSNVITVTATDMIGQAKSATLTVNYSTAGSPPPPTTSDIIWSATAQTGDTVWKESAVMRCVRLLIQGSQIKQSGNVIQLGFRGRPGTSYTIQEVSIAEKDANVAQGNVLDATWNRVTFNGRPLSSWKTDVVTIPPGTEKLSDAIPFTIQAGKDYYVTFKINSPSVYLDPPAGYAELYFDTADRSNIMDWSGAGYITDRVYHALSSIRISSGPAIRPAAPKGLTVVSGTN